MYSELYKLKHETIYYSILKEFVENFRRDNSQILTLLVLHQTQFIDNNMIIHS